MRKGVPRCPFSGLHGYEGGMAEGGMAEVI